MKSGFLTAVCPIIAALFLAQPAKADWYEASSDHFIIFADDDEEELRRYAENLERYHGAMEHFTGRAVEKPSPSNRISVYAVGSLGEVRKLAGSNSIAGFYIPRTDGSVAFVQDIRNKEGRPDLSSVVLLHEYAHHFLSSTDRFAMPLWMNEGAAEFFSAARFRDDGSVLLGLASSHRDSTIFWKEEEMTPVREVFGLDWQTLSGWQNKAKDSFYGRSWLLYHYLSMDESRSGQLRQYWLEVLKGTPSPEAAQNIFGDFGVLERQLNFHYRSRSRQSYVVSSDEIDVGAVVLRRLDYGEAAVMNVRIRSERGVAGQDATDLAAEARAIAADFSDNPAVLAMLAKAEFDAENDDAAIAAANQALAIDPKRVDAYLYKGLAGFRKARGVSDAAQKDVAYLRAMEAMTGLAEIEEAHIMPLIYQYRLDAERGIDPSSDAKNALVRAAELAAFDEELWLITGMMHMNDGRIADARSALQPLASNPHGGGKAEQVRSLLAYLSDKPEGQAIPVQAAISTYFIEE
ncbi:hypothetical protein [Erythrobacter crassostreae]|uniref:DUF1570 domain-containing protein n=1 Tax=Erythrobacter crassostreae TaxID=2828328 RepID=A0A9X1F337_9SPHN|nr:hypothetical protein [Erythrobacter crassostrea]MBV7259426.1 hypothetical protein [Erythrobacter crassostrea]